MAHDELAQILTALPDRYDKGKVTLLINLENFSLDKFSTVIEHARPSMVFKEVIITNSKPEISDHKGLSILMSRSKTLLLDRLVRDFTSLITFPLIMTFYLSTGTLESP